MRGNACSKPIGCSQTVQGLARQAVLAGVPWAIAQVLHAAMAAALARRGHAAEDVAPHWQAAGCWPEAATAFSHAAHEVCRRRLYPALKTATRTTGNCGPG
jgi:hypothetical protein